MRHKQLLIIITSILLLSNCSIKGKETITWLPPKNATGSSCVQNCFLEKAKCVQTAHPSTCNLREIQQKAQSMPIDQAIKINNKLMVFYPKNCAIKTKCQTKYQACFIKCGGQIIVHKAIESS